jgi:hypothetical protein
MTDNNPTFRPWWVRLFARPGSRRQSVRAGALACALLAVIALLICSVEAQSETVLGRTAFIVGAVLAPITALLALGAFLALRWGDRNGAWKSGPSPPGQP